MTPEQLELAITHYLDGTLPPEDVAALEQTLANDPAAQGLLQDHENLTALLRSDPLPDLDWSEVASDLCAVITGTVDEQSRAEDQKLNAVLKAAVTPLPEIRWDELAARVSASIDAELVATDGQDERLDELLQSDPLPAVNWDKFASLLSNAVAAEVAGAKREEERPAVIGRIGFASRFRQMAIAAAVMLAAAVGIKVATNSNQSLPPNKGTEVVVNPIPKLPKPSQFFVEAPSVELAGKPGTVEVEIGPSASYAANVEDDYARRGTLSRSPVVIALPSVHVRTDEDAETAFMFD
jgi:anti-sigma factor RsiW